MLAAFLDKENALRAVKPGEHFFFDSLIIP